MSNGWTAMKSSPASGPAGTRSCASGRRVPLDFTTGSLAAFYRLNSFLYRTAYQATYSLHRAIVRLGNLAAGRIALAAAEGVLRLPAMDLREHPVMVVAGDTIIGLSVIRSLGLPGSAGLLRHYAGRRAGAALRLLSRDRFECLKIPPRHSLRCGSTSADGASRM